MILETAAELLAQSATGDISTRAVCEAAGVTQPVLYRHFGDKDGLLAAVADRVWGEYLSSKRAAESSADPLDDLRSGWDNHTAFALRHPHAYRLVFASTLATRPAAMAEAMSLLQGILHRLAAQGRLRIPAADAARVVMAANSGVALGLILRPEEYPDASASGTTRDAVLGSLVIDGAPEHDPVAAAAITLTTRLGSAEAFTPAERSLLAEWLQRLA
ncbi:TetR/AcrR family transcriptional regulator [Microbacterium esteraromaticum]|uniref:TetR/AcrR family transcriptional regulator n=1 Tax=Microbacterium esteraromaticum TaxID=57043 RepID=A0A7D8AF40_9MICO|nr:TetR/AcrR family transcriptional regulator [Microbacterium esteraromaticum]